MVTKQVDSREMIPFNFGWQGQCQTIGLNPSWSPLNIFKTIHMYQAMPF